MKTGLIISMLAILTLSACSQQTTTPAANSGTENRSLNLPAPGYHKTIAFEREKQKLIQRDETIDFRILRMSYAQTSSYDPWNTQLHEASLAMFNAFEDGQFELCLTFSRAILDGNYVSLAGHFGAMNCLNALDRTKEAAFHNYVVTGLMVSIAESGDGLSPESAFVTISPTEMRSFMQIRGLVSYRQELVVGTSKHVEKIYAVDTATNQHHEIYFDNSIALLPRLQAPGFK